MSGFIVLEGIDGSGTTTQAKRLVERLSELGHDAICTREPSSGPVGRFIRDVLEHRVVVEDSNGSRAPDWSTLALLFAADRADHPVVYLRLVGSQQGLDPPNDIEFGRTLGDGRPRRGGCCLGLHQP